MNGKFRPSFWATFGAMASDCVYHSDVDPPLFLMSGRASNLSDEEQIEVARRDPGVWLERGSRSAIAGPDVDGTRVLVKLYRCLVPLSPGIDPVASEWEGVVDSAERAAALVREFLDTTIEESMERVVAAFPGVGIVR
jgi:hypothetical protein